MPRWYAAPGFCPDHAAAVPTRTGCRRYRTDKGQITPDEYGAVDSSSTRLVVLAERGVTAGRWGLPVVEHRPS